MDAAAEDAGGLGDDELGMDFEETFDRVNALEAEDVVAIVADGVETLGWFEDEFTAVEADMVGLVGVAAVEGGDGTEERFLAEVESDEGVGVAEKCFVVGHAAAGGVGDDDAAAAEAAHEAGNARHVGGAESDGIERGAADAAVEDIDFFKAADGFEEDLAVSDEEVGRFGHGDAHAAGEETFLEIFVTRFNVVEEDDVGFFFRGERAEGLDEAGGEGGDGLGVEAFEDFGKNLAEEAAVLERVTGTEREGEVVFEHEPFAFGGAGQVEGAEGDEIALGEGEAAHFAEEGGIAEDDGVGDGAVAEDVLLAVDVADEEVEGARALEDALADEFPLGGGDDAGEDVERVAAGGAVAGGAGRGDFEAGGGAGEPFAAGAEIGQGGVANELEEGTDEGCGLGRGGPPFGPGTGVEKGP
jgi:hypothetical protein